MIMQVYALQHLLILAILLCLISGAEAGIAEG